MASSKGAGKGAPFLCLAVFFFIVALTFGLVCCITRGWVTEDGGSDDIQIGIWRSCINDTCGAFDEFLPDDDCTDHLMRSTRAVRAMTIIGIVFSFFSLVCGLVGCRASAASLAGACCAFFAFTSYLCAFVIVFVVWSDQDHCTGLARPLVSFGADYYVKFQGTKWGYCHWLMLVAWIVSLLGTFLFCLAYGNRTKPKARFPPDEEFPVPQFPVNYAPGYPGGPGYPVLTPQNQPELFAPVGNQTFYPTYA
eukprot:NODE_3843_length_908_cov_294.876601_g3537_i0.p1 GENE.NODE_3843_length_908_cov_294.876601_g3537_i0~~NODE_3843_length_908_cov_294.876601_g3537_i0.p1  ORF type:complete len:251 (-),score=18.58 NODE_3843_length_908_cov_294.876601_g3537_i0:91-843(-)